MLKRLKQSLLLLTRSLGVMAAVASSRWRRRRLLILCYHGISLDDEHEWDPSLYMSPEQFRARLHRLRAGGYTVLLLDEAVRKLREGRLPPRAVAITFDDGHHDFHERALPILREFGIPVTVYLTTYYCLDQRAVFDMVCGYILWKGRDRIVDGEPFTGAAGPMRLVTEADRRAACDRIHAQVRDRGLSAADKDALAARLAGALGVDWERIRSRRILHIMTPDEVREAAVAGVDIQLHTHRHRTPREPDAFAREIRDNRAAVAELALPGKPAVHFCYPSGDTDPRFLPWLRDEGVRTATTCEAGLAAPHHDPLLLPRVIDVSTLSDVEFEGWLSGLSSALPRRGA